MQYLTSDEVKSLELKANLIRQSIIEMLSEAGSGHTAGPLGMADVFALLYFGILKHDPEKPDWQYHIRIFCDGEVRGHYEMTPEDHSFTHMKSTNTIDKEKELKEMVSDIT